MLTEIVRLPVPPGGSEALVAFMRAHAFYRQEALLSHRFFDSEDDSEVVVIIEWRSREEMRATSDNDLSTRFREELAPYLAGPPTLGVYVPAT